MKTKLPISYICKGKAKIPTLLREEGMASVREKGRFISRDSVFAQSGRGKLSHAEMPQGR